MAAGPRSRSRADPCMAACPRSRSRADPCMAGCHVPIERAQTALAGCHVPIVRVQASVAGWRGSREQPRGPAVLKQSSPKWACGWVGSWRSAAELRAARPLGCSLLLRNSRVGRFGWLALASQLAEWTVWVARSCFATRGVDALGGSRLLCKSRGASGGGGVLGLLGRRGRGLALGGWLLARGSARRCGRGRA